MDATTLKLRWSEALGEAALATLGSGETYRPQPAPGPGGALAFGLDFGAGRPLGRGGMGEVRSVPQRLLERSLAVKFLRRDRDASLDGFLAEAVAHGRLSHPGIVPVYFLGERDGDVFLTMPEVRGKTWREVRRERPEALDFHLGVLEKVGEALAYAHSQDIVHNDLKPSNVMLGEFGEVYLLDWGLAVHVGERRPESRLRHKSALRSPCGTPAYLPPELALGQGAQIGPWTDVYLLGATLYELLTGAPPHSAPNLAESLLRMVSASSRLEFPADAPAELVALCRRALAFRPEERPADAGEFLAGLRTWTRHRESHALARGAEQRLRDCVARAGEPGAKGLYSAFSAVVARYEAALELWEDNAEARRGLAEACCAHAALALARADFGLAEAQLARLDEDHPSARELRASIAAARQRARREVAHAARLRRAVRGLAVTLLVGLAVAVGVLLERNAQIAARTRRIEVQNDSLLFLQRAAENREQVAVASLSALSDGLQRMLQERKEDRYFVDSAREYLVEALRGWESLARFAPDERWSLGRAEAHTRIGELMFAVELDADSALAELAEAERLLVGLDSEEAFSMLCRARLARGTALIHRGALDATEELCARAEQELRARPEDPALREYRELFALLRGRCAELRGKLEDALEAFRDSHAQVARQLAADPENLALRRRHSLAQQRVGGILQQLERREEARVPLEAAVAESEALVAERPWSTSLRRTLATQLRDLGLTWPSGPDAAECFTRSLALFQQLRLAHPDATGLAFYEARLEADLGDCACALGDDAGAEERYLRALAMMEELVREDPDAPLLVKELSLDHERLGEVYFRADDQDRALPAFEEARRLRATLFAADRANLQHRRLLCAAEVDSAWSLWRKAEPLAARAVLDSAFAHVAVLRLDDPKLASVGRLRQDLLSVWVGTDPAGRAAGELDFQRRELAALRAAGADPADERGRQVLSASLFRLGRSLLLGGSPDEAGPPLEEALAVASAGPELADAALAVLELLVTQRLLAGEPAAARSLLAQHAAAIAEAAPLPRAKLTRLIAHAHAALGEPAAARAALEAACALLVPLAAEDPRSAALLASWQEERAAWD